MTTICWIDGRWHGADEPLIAPTDRGFLYGDGVFETLRSRNGRFFRLERHLARLQRGMDVLSIHPGDGVTEALEALPGVFEQFDAGDVVIRLSVTRGNGWLQARPSAQGLVSILAKPAPSSPPDAGRAVLSSVVCDATSPVADIKTCNWLPNILARQEAEGLGFDEAILCNGLGYLTEASSSNLFWTIDGELFTPAIESGALPGITREAVIEAAKSIHINVYEGSYLPEALSESEAAFVTNSVFGIKQLISFGEAPLLKEDPSRVVVRVREQLACLIDSEIEVTGVG